MTWTQFRTLGISAAVALSLAALCTVLIADAANAGGDKPGPRCNQHKATVNGLTGTSGDDIIVGTDRGDEINGKGGDDKICGRGGRDDINGGGGDDLIFAGAQRDRAFGGPGNDRLRGQGGDDGFAGKGFFPGMVGGPGNDYIGGGAGNDVLFGEDGQDTHNGSYGEDWCLDKDEGSEFNSCENDFPERKGGKQRRCGSQAATVPGNTGTNGNDMIVGTAQAEEINAMGGNDRICARGGRDVIFAGDGKDIVFAGNGRDHIEGGTGNDDLRGQSGPDQPPNDQNDRRGSQGTPGGVYGGDGNDIVSGGSGNDRIFGEIGTDFLSGGDDIDGCFDEDPDSEYIGCEYGSGPPPP